MDVIPSNNEKTVKVEGFIGNVKSDDKVETIEVSLVDDKGKVVGEKVVLSGDDIKAIAKKYSYGGNSPYNGLGYTFSATLPVKDFLMKS